MGMRYSVWLSLLDDPGRLKSGISQQEQAHLGDLVGFEPKYIEDALVHGNPGAGAHAAEGRCDEDGLLTIDDILEVEPEAAQRLGVLGEPPQRCLPTAVYASIGKFRGVIEDDVGMPALLSGPVERTFMHAWMPRRNRSATS
jgi:hypothetical protein